MGEKGAVRYAIALAPQLAEHFLRQWLFNRWEKPVKEANFCALENPCLFSLLLGQVSGESALAG